MLHGTFDFVLFLLAAISTVYPDKAGLCDTLSIVFAVSLTLGGTCVAVVMFNNVSNLDYTVQVLYYMYKISIDN